MWSASEYNSNNAWNVNSNGNLNNNNKSNQFGVVPALEIVPMPALRLTDSYSYRDIVLAYLDCRRRKRNKRSAIAFETNFETNLGNLLEEVNSGSYRIGSSQVFVVTHPKPREIWAAGFRDRIVHHLVYRDIAPWYESRFIEDTFSCIRGRGTQAAAQRLERFCRQATENWSRGAWCLQIDIANFFVSINRPILWSVLAQDIGETSLTARLLKQVLFHDPTQSPHIKTPHLLHLVPQHKSLWHCKPGCGLPIGNLTSQFLSNVYLDALDKFTKHVLKTRWYARYVDDAVLLSHDRSQLYEWKDAIDEWLKHERGLRLHPNKVTVKPADSGINFVGTVVLPFRSYPRKMTVHSAARAAHALSKTPLDKGYFDTLNSYIGMMRNTTSFNIRKRLCEKASTPMLIASDSEYTKIITL